MKVSWIDLTPELAASLLEKNPKNRTIRQNLVRKYAADMAHGRWKESPQGISISEDGTIMDGQHRCLAVIASGVTIHTLLVTEVPEVSRLVMDTGAAKTAGDILHMHGTNNASQVATACRYYLLYRNFPESVWTSAMITKQEAVEFGLANADDVLDGLSVGRLMTSGARSVTLMPFAVFTMLVNADSEAKSLLEEFVHGIQTGVGLAADDPRYILREMQFNLVGSWRAQATLGCTIKAWNAFVSDRPMRSLRFRRNELPMPQVI